MSQPYDAIVVGARCAGSPTAMLLARSGYRVLLLDRASFPSDTLSTHMVHLPGIAALDRWGLLDRLVATGCPPLPRYRFDFGPFVLDGAPRPIGRLRDAYAPRRTILDQLLVDAAVEAGAELREHFTVDELVVRDGRVEGIRGRDRHGRSVVEHARLVIGADGRHSVVAKAVGAERYVDRPAYEAGYYAYWSGLPSPGFEVWIRPYRSFAVISTHEDLSLVIVTWPIAEFHANRKDVEGNYLRSMELVPELAARVRAARRESRISGTGDLPNFFRKPYGPGWALVGDAGYHKDPVTAQGISDAFRDAELLARAVGETLGGERTFDEAMSDYQQTRDAKAMPMFELTCEFATLEPPPPEMAQLFAAMAGNQEAMDGWASVAAGTVPVPEFFAPENVERIMQRASADAVAVPA